MLRCLIAVACSLWATCSFGQSSPASIPPGSTAEIVCGSKAEGVALHATASATLPVADVLSCGYKLTVVAKETDWYRVRTQDGKEGYVKDAFLAATSPVGQTISHTSDGYIVCVPAGATVTDLMESPTSVRTVMLLQCGEKVALLEEGSRGNENWDKVETTGGSVGYVMRWLVSANPPTAQSQFSLSPKTTSIGRDWAVFNQKRDAVWDALVDTMTSYNWRPQTLDAASGVVFFQSDGSWGDFWGANNALVARFTTKHVGRMATWVSVALETNAHVKAVDQLHTEVRFTVKYAGCNGAQALFDQYSKCHWEPLESNGVLESEMLARIASHLTQLSDSELNPPSKPESNVVAAARDQVMAFQKLSATFELNAPPDRILSALVDTKASLETFRETPESRALPKFTAALEQAIHSYVAAANATGEQRSSLLEGAEVKVWYAKKCFHNYQEYVQEITPKSAGTPDEGGRQGTPKYMQQTPPSSTQQTVVHQQEPAPSTPVQQATVEFWSSPAGADIEVDGKHMGSTPSTVTVQAGEHTITMRKQDFGTWQKTIKVTSGNLRVAAYMQQVGVTLH